MTDRVVRAAAASGAKLNVARLVWGSVAICIRYRHRRSGEGGCQSPFGEIESEAADRKRWNDHERAAKIEALAALFAVKLKVADIPAG